MSDKPLPSPRASSILVTLEEAPTPAEVKRAHNDGARFLDIDFDKAGADRAKGAAKVLGMKVTAYHVGPGGGDVWGEEKRDFRDQAELDKFAGEVKALVERGADFIHLDNVHNLGVKALTKVLDIVKDAGGLAIVKNAPERFRKIIAKRPDLKPPYALLEHTAQDKDDLEEGRQLAEMGVEVFLVEFQAVIEPGDRDPMTPEAAAATARDNPWLSGVILLPDERAFDNREGRGATFYSTIDGRQGSNERAPDAGSKTRHAAAPGAGGTGNDWHGQPRAPRGDPHGGQWVKGFAVGSRLKALM